MQPTQDEQIRDLLQAGKSEEEAARILGISRYHIRKLKGSLPRQRARAFYLDHRAPPPPAPVASVFNSTPVDQPPIATPTSMPHRDAAIHGKTVPEADEFDATTLWNAAMHAAQQSAAAWHKKRDQRITLPDEPVALAFLSDLHFGGASVDYGAAKRDAELIRATPGMYAICHGDMLDNWIVGKLQSLQRGQAVGYDGELLLFRDYLNILRGKLKVMVAGNHDNWTYKLSGIDLLESALQGTRLLYDRNQVVFTLEHGQHPRVICVRHKWRYGSVYNPVHGLTVGWQRGDIDYDIAVGGHTHIGTMCVPFWGHGKRRYAVLTGTYKAFGDSFGSELGLPDSKDRGCGAMVLLPDGRMFWTEDLQTAADFLAYARQRHGAACSY